jgi:hypothetical protein
MTFHNAEGVEQDARQIRDLGFENELFNTFGVVEHFLYFPPIASRAIHI